MQFSYSGRTVLTLVQHLKFQVVLMVPLDHPIDLPGIDLLAALPAAIRAQFVCSIKKYSETLLSLRSGFHSDFSLKIFLCRNKRKCI